MTERVLSFWMVGSGRAIRFHISVEYKDLKIKITPNKMSLVDAIGYTMDHFLFRYNSARYYALKNENSNMAEIHLRKAIEWG